MSVSASPTAHSVAMTERRSCHRRDPNDMTRAELIHAVTILRKSLDERPFKNRGESAAIAVDRTGKKYTRDELFTVFERVYPENPKALLLLFPTMTLSSVRHRALRFGICRPGSKFTADEDTAIRASFPNYAKIAKELGRLIPSVQKRAAVLGLQLPSNGPNWTPEEDALLRQGLDVPTRSKKSQEVRRSRLGINKRFVLTARAMPIDELRTLVASHVAKNYPEQYRTEAVSDVIEMCLQGRCGTEPEQLAAAGKKAISAVYKLHPDRGAPSSLDAQIYDDGGTTVGDRIHSDAFHF